MGNIEKEKEYTNRNSDWVENNREDDETENKVSLVKTHSTDQANWLNNEIIDGETNGRGTLKPFPNGEVGSSLFPEDECDERALRLSSHNEESHVNEPSLMKRSKGMSPLLESRGESADPSPKLEDSAEEKVKVIQVHVKSSAQSCQNQSSSDNEAARENQSPVPTSAQTKDTPPLIAKTKQRKAPLIDAMSSTQEENHNEMEVRSSNPTPTTGGGKETDDDVGNESIRLVQVDQLEQRMMNQILVMRPRPVATIQLDRSPTLLPVTMDHDFAGKR
jgi:hypothetical protein